MVPPTLVNSFGLRMLNAIGSGLLVANSCGRSTLSLWCRVLRSRRQPFSSVSGSRQLGSQPWWPGLRSRSGSPASRHCPRRGKRRRCAQGFEFGCAVSRFLGEEDPASHIGAFEGDGRVIDDPAIQLDLLIGLR